ncbi:hypothetical protein ACPCSC_32965 [Streptomyces lavendulocolor]
MGPYSTGTSRHGDSAALTRLFEITAQTAMRYVGTACRSAP